MPISTAADAVEEQFEGESTGLEIEESDNDDHRPWNPDDIRVTTKNFSIRHVLDMIDEGSLELAPDFQRNQVWRPRQRSRLIESILLQIPLPAFYFAEDTDSAMRVVDGQQRLSTVWEFVRSDNPFPLSGLEYLGDRHDGKSFRDLEPVLQRRLHNTQIVAHVIDPTTPPDVVFNIFKRINTGGTPLKAQEIRHCMSKRRSRDFLRRCAETPEFDRATAGSLRSNLRMGDREVALRFCAFRLRSIQAYRDSGSMDTFLLQVTRQLDDPTAVDDDGLETLWEDFRRAMVNARRVFGEHAFRKFRRGQSHRNPVNRPLFECWAVALAEYSPDDIAARASAILDAAADLMEDSEYVDAITSSTGDPRSVAYRHDRTRRAAQAS